MSGIPDEELELQLNTFMRSIPLNWTWNELQKFYDRNEQYTDERSIDSNCISFEFSILEDDIQNGRRYLNISVNINDSRKGIGKGSVFQPLGNNFIYYQDGKIDIQDL